MPEVEPRIVDIFQQIVAVDDDMRAASKSRCARCRASLFGGLPHRDQGDAQDIPIFTMNGALAGVCLWKAAGTTTCSTIHSRTPNPSPISKNITGLIQLTRPDLLVWRERAQHAAQVEQHGCVYGRLVRRDHGNGGLDARLRQLFLRLCQQREAAGSSDAQGDGAENGLLGDSSGAKSVTMWMQSTKQTTLPVNSAC